MLVVFTVVEDGSVVVVVDRVVVVDAGAVVVVEVPTSILRGSISQTLRKVSL